MVKGSGGGGKSGRTGGGGSGELDALQQESTAKKAELDKIKDGIKKLNDVYYSQSLMSDKNAKDLRDRLYENIESAKEKAYKLEDDLYEIGNKIWGIKHKNDVPTKPDYGETELPANFKFSKPSKPIKKLKKEGLYDDPGATNSWKDYY